MATQRSASLSRRSWDKSVREKGSPVISRFVQQSPVEPQTAFVRAKYALQDGIGRLDRLGADATRTDAARHDAAKVLYDRMAGEVRNAAKTAATWAATELQAAQRGLNAVLAPSSDKAGLYAEIRAHVASRRTDPDFSLSALVKSSRDTAVAVASAPFFLSGISEERHRDISVTAMMAHAPEEAERIVAAKAIAGEAERMEKGLQEIQPAFYVDSVAAKMGSFVDVDAPFAEAPPVAAE